MSDSHAQCQELAAAPLFLWSRHLFHVICLKLIPYNIAHYTFWRIRGKSAKVQFDNMGSPGITPVPAAGSHLVINTRDLNDGSSTNASIVVRKQQWPEITTSVHMDCEFADGHGDTPKSPKLQQDSIDVLFPKSPSLSDIPSTLTPYSELPSPKKSALSRRPQTAPGPKQCFHVRFTVPNSPSSPSPRFYRPPEYKLPTTIQLEDAASLPVVAENGESILFGQLWLSQKTIVIFIRHFWCPLCQDYMFSISRSVPPVAIFQRRVKLVIISNGSYKLIKSYRRVFRTPFQVYTDPTHRLYDALDMVSTAVKQGPHGKYVRHSALGGIRMVITNAFKAGMPIWENGGDFSQLGGEFILGPGLTCSFAHRMQNTSSHLPILRVIAEAGIDMTSPAQQATNLMTLPFPTTEEEEAVWMQERRRSLERLKEKKARRRGGSQWCAGTACQVISLLEDEDPDTILCGH